MTEKMIVVVDLGRVRAYRVIPDETSSRPRIELVQDLEFVESHERMETRVSDHAGQFPASGTGAMSNGEDHHLKQETERRLIKQAAEKINEAVAGERTWYLAAAAEINARLVEHLSPKAKASLARNVQADLVKVPKQELADYFRA